MTRRAPVGIYDHVTERARYVRGTPEERFWAKVDKNGPVPEYRPDLGPCWLWTASGVGGYGRFGITAKEKVLAHRYAWILEYGAIPDALEPDHLCRVLLCVRTKHLELVTHAENVRRGVSPPAVHATKTHCRWDHEFSPENTRIRANGSRFCIACQNIRNARR